MKIEEVPIKRFHISEDLAEISLLLDESATELEFSYQEEFHGKDYTFIIKDHKTVMSFLKMAHALFEEIKKVTPTKND